MMASEVTDLPQPDSPTNPTTWPGETSKLTPSTATVGGGSPRPAPAGAAERHPQIPHLEQWGTHPPRQLPSPGRTHPPRRLRKLRGFRLPGSVIA